MWLNVWIYCDWLRLLTYKFVQWVGFRVQYKMTDNHIWVHPRAMLAFCVFVEIPDLLYPNISSHHNHTVESCPCLSRNATYCEIAESPSDKTATVSKWNRTTNHSHKLEVTCNIRKPKKKKEWKKERNKKSLSMNYPIWMNAWKQILQCVLPVSPEQIELCVCVWKANSLLKVRQFETEKEEQTHKQCLSNCRTWDEPYTRNRHTID